LEYFIQKYEIVLGRKSKVRAMSTQNSSRNRHHRHPQCTHSAILLQFLHLHTALHLLRCAIACPCLPPSPQSHTS
jgi:hypothetical protein